MSRCSSQNICGIQKYLITTLSDSIFKILLSKQVRFNTIFIWLETIWSAIRKKGFKTFCWDFGRSPKDLPFLSPKTLLKQALRHILLFFDVFLCKLYSEVEYFSWFTSNICWKKWELLISPVWTFFRG